MWTKCSFLIILICIQFSSLLLHVKQECENALHFKKYSLNWCNKIFFAFAFFSYSLNLLKCLEKWESARKIDWFRFQLSWDTYSLMYRHIVSRIATHWCLTVAVTGCAKIYLSSDLILEAPWQHWNGGVCDIDNNNFEWKGKVNQWIKSYWSIYWIIRNDWTSVSPFFAHALYIRDYCFFRLLLLLFLSSFILLL